MTRALRIAVADDEPVVRDYFLRMLPRMGHQVVAAAATGSELVEKCRQHQPDLIIADIRMPDMDGDVAIQQICSDRPTPFILISAYSKPSFSPDNASPISRAYLTKPIKREDLEEAIAQVCHTIN
jgi:two-component system, response regulator PdtaR